MSTATRGRVRVETSPKRVRAFLGGLPVVDSTAPLLVWESPYYPTYYFQAADVDTSLLADTGEVRRSPSRGEATIHDIVTARATAEGGAFHHADAEIDELHDTYSFTWDALDSWFEEEEQVYVHARSPYTRIDILQSSRHVEVYIDDVKVADTHQPRLLFETGLQTRYYMPKTDVRMDLLAATELTTACPYKGTASYYTVTTDDAAHENVVWWYPAPLAESQDIAGMVSFYNEKVDIVVDGEPEQHD